jgi:hypothetical protein
MGFIIGIVVVLTLGFLIFSAIEKSNMKDEMAEAIKDLSDFTASQSVVGEDGMNGFAIDEKRGLLCLLSRQYKEVIPCVVPYADVVSVEVTEDGSSVTKTSRSSQIGGAVVGGVLLGGVGAVVGGLTGSKKTTQKVKRVDLRVVIDNIGSPTHNVCFLDLDVDRGGIVHKAALDKARHWNGLFDIAINRADKARVQDVNVVRNEKQKSIKPSGSVADELRKLADLKADGVLTEDEFQAQKQRLLRST